jgi:glycerophosphoryl diester phosphodiesterase
MTATPASFPEIGNWFRRQPGSSPWIVAHRGGAGLFPENTRTAFAGVAGFAREGNLPRLLAAELDVQSTADGVPVVFHDDTLERLTNGIGPVRQYSLAQLQKEIRCADGLPPPSLTEVCRVLASSPLRLFVEIKDPAITSATLAVLQNEGWQERCVVGSFHAEVLAALPEEAGWAGLWLLPPREENGGQGLQPPSPVIRLMGLSRQQATPENVAFWQQRNYAVWVYTVNSPTDRVGLTATGADALISDFPDQMHHPA